MVVFVAATSGSIGLLERGEEVDGRGIGEEKCGLTLYLARALAPLQKEGFEQAQAAKFS